MLHELVNQRENNTWWLQPLRTVDRQPSHSSFMISGCPVTWLRVNTSTQGSVSVWGVHGWAAAWQRDGQHCREKDETKRRGRAVGAHEKGKAWEGGVPKCYKITDSFTSEGHGGCFLERLRATTLHITGFPMLMYSHRSVKQSRRCLYIEQRVEKRPSYCFLYLLSDTSFMMININGVRQKDTRLLLLLFCCWQEVKDWLA